MVLAFDSDVFFDDPYFQGDGNGAALTATINGVSYDSIFVDDLDPIRKGQLKSRPGHWATLYIPVRELAVKPIPQTPVTIDGEIWYCDAAEKKADVWAIPIVTLQRKLK